VTHRDSHDQRLLGLVLGGIAIRHVAALVAIAREPSSTAAATRLGCAQSTLTASISELEEAVGARLVASGPEGARLTEGGERLLPHAEAVLARVEAARAELARMG
jgi:DNA-binding transcriptional LysR family regulator